MKANLDTKTEQIKNEHQKMRADLEVQKQQLEEKELDFNCKFDKAIKTDKSKDLQEAKERKSTRTIKNNELEEQWNIRKIEMRKQRDKYINESEEKKELQIQHTKLDEA